MVKYGGLCQKVDNPDKDQSKKTMKSGYFVALPLSKTYKGCGLCQGRASLSPKMNFRLGLNQSIKPKTRMPLQWAAMIVSLPLTTGDRQWSFPLPPSFLLYHRVDLSYAQPQSATQTQGSRGNSCREHSPISLKMFSHDTGSWLSTLLTNRS